MYVGDSLKIVGRIRCPGSGKRTPHTFTRLFLCIATQLTQERNELRVIEHPLERESR